MRLSRIRVAIPMFVVLALSHAAPSVAAIAPPAISSPADGAVTKASITITGTGVAGTTVEVFDNAGSLGSTTVAGNGGWAKSVVLADGPHTLTATASDGTQTSAPSAPRNIQTDGVRPAVDIATPVEDHVFGPDQSVLIEGTASDTRALSAIRLEYWRLGSLVKQELAECTCSGATSASWRHEPVLEPGDWTVKAFAADQAANYSLADTVSFMTVAAGMGFEAPEIPGLSGIQPPDILGPKEGETVPGAAEPVTIGGSTEPGSTVEVYEEVDGVGPMGTAADTDEDGRWSMTVRLPTGVYGIRAVATDAQGNVSEPSELIEFTVDGERPLVGLLTPDKKVFLPLEPVILEGTVTDNFAVASVVLEYFDARGRSVLRDRALCGCTGDEAAWRHEPSLPFGPGHYTVKVWAFDAAGNGAHKQTLSIIKSL